MRLKEIKTFLILYGQSTYVLTAVQGKNPTLQKNPATPFFTPKPVYFAVKL